MISKLLISELLLQTKIILSPMNLDLEVHAYQIGEGNEGSLITDESIVDLLSQASGISQNCV